jgi:hypothetical protein
MLIVLSGCTTLDDLTPPKNDIEFVLEEDIINFYDAGMFDTRWARGLLKGTYKIAGEDKKGYYFMPVTGQVIQLFGDPAKEFEESRTYPSGKDYEFVGGLWVPKNRGEKFNIFQVLVARYDNIYEPGHGGVIQAGAAALLDGGIVFWGSEGLPDFSKIILIKELKN